MSDSYILTVKDHKEWSNLLEKCKQADIHFTPEYMKLYQKRLNLINSSEAMLFVTKFSEKDFVLYPFFKRKINDKPIFSHMKEVLYDIVSPWYFGGILISSDENLNEKLKNFWDDFTNFAKKNYIITEFTRLHPLLPGNDIFGEICGAKYQYDISYIDLKQSFENIWKDFKKSNRNSVNSSQRKGVVIELSNSENALRKFFELYTNTMKRLHAENPYFFSYEFLKEVQDEFKNNMLIVSAVLENKVIASSIFLHKYGIVHYWLSGFDTNYRSYFPNNLLITEAIKWAKEQGEKTFCLMGGSNKNLQIFKESFSSTKTKFFTLSKVYDQEKYDHLNKIRNRVEKIDRLDFFPLYRT